MPGLMLVVRAGFVLWSLLRQDHDSLSTSRQLPDSVLPVVKQNVIDIL